MFRTILRDRVPEVDVGVALTLWTISLQADSILLALAAAVLVVTGVAHHSRRKEARR